MGFLLIAGFGVILLGTTLYFSYCLPKWVSCLLAVILAFMFVFAFAFAFCPPFPVAYEETKLSYTQELVSLRDTTSISGTGNRFYLSISPDNAYTYYYEVNSNYANNNEKAYKSNTVSAEYHNVTVIETDAETATLQVYVQSPKNSFWSFERHNIYEYVFRVPKGTIVRQIELGN